MFQNGTLTVDYSNSVCLNHVFTPMAELSVFDSFDEENDAAIFVNGLQEYSGLIRIKESSGVVGTEVNVLKLDKSLKKFEVELTLVSCVALTETPTLLPSQIPSTSPSKELSFAPSHKPSTLPSNLPSLVLSPLPSQIPSTLICPIEGVLGAVYVYRLNGICWRIEIFENGKMTADFFSKTCSNAFFQPTVEFSVFDSIDQERNAALFLNTQQQSTWLVHFKKSLTATETGVEVLKWDVTSGEFEIELTVISCTEMTKRPSMLPSQIPSILPSKEFSMSPSQIPSMSPSDVPSLLPSKEFSVSPSQIPSVSPSEEPTFAPICTMNQVFGAVYRFVQNNMCWRVEMIENGKIEVDFYDSTCSREVFTPTIEFGVFDTINDDYDAAIFVKSRDLVDEDSKLFSFLKTLGYSLVVRFKELRNVINVKGDMTWDAASSEYHIGIRLNSCTAMTEMLPSQSPTLMPSEMPSALPSLPLSQMPTIYFEDCTINQVFGAVYRFVQNNMCWRVEMFENGKIEADLFDSTCSKEVFTSIVQFGLFESVNEDNGVAVFANRLQDYNLFVSFKESPSVINVEGDMTLETALSEYYIVIKLNSCTVMTGMFPSQRPSTTPSLSPTKPLICPIDQILGMTYTFTFNKACWKLELFEKGALKVDVTDSMCSNTSSTSYIVMSVFSSVDHDSNVVLYNASGPQQYSGSIRFRESKHATDTSVTLIL